MKIQILPEANEDLIAGYYFYEKQNHGPGSYFLNSLFSDIESLIFLARIHAIVFGSHRCFSRRFPFAIYMSWKAKRFAYRPFMTVGKIRPKYDGD